MSTDKYWEILILILICKLDRVKGQIIMLGEKIGRGFGLWKTTSKEISLTPYNTIYTHFRAIVAGWRYLTTPSLPIWERCTPFVEIKLYKYTAMLLQSRYTLSPCVGELLPLAFV